MINQAQENALRLARWLQERPEVTRVIYPGLSDHPGHEIMKKQARGFGAVLSFEIVSVELVKQILEHVELIAFAESLGGVESLITYPITPCRCSVTGT